MACIKLPDVSGKRVGAAQGLQAAAQKVAAALSSISSETPAAAASVKQEWLQPPAETSPEQALTAKVSPSGASCGEWLTDDAGHDRWHAGALVADAPCPSGTSEPQTGTSRTDSGPLCSQLGAHAALPDTTALTD